MQKYHKDSKKVHFVYNKKILIQKMNSQQNEDFDKNFFDQDNAGYFPLQNKQNDSVGNNSGGGRSRRDQDLDFMDDRYEDKYQRKMEIQKETLINHNEQFIGPQNSNDAQNASNRQSEISLYDIQALLSQKTIKISSLKKTFETILQYLNTFRLEQLRKFIRLIVQMPAFDETFQKQKLKKKTSLMQQKNGDYDQVLSDISAKSDKLYRLPENGIEAYFQTVLFLRELISKCSFVDNHHLITLLRQILNTQSRFFNLPLRPEQLIQENCQFVQKSSNRQRFQSVQQQIQNSYVAMFQFQQQVTQLRQMLFYFFSSVSMRNFFHKPAEQEQTSHLSTKLRIHNILLMNQLILASNELFTKFGTTNEQSKYLQISKAQFGKIPNKQELEDYVNAVFQLCHRNATKIINYIRPIIEMLVEEDNSIEKKSLGLKLVDRLIANVKIHQETEKQVANILNELKIIDHFFKDQTHSQLLRKMPPIVKFMYQLQMIDLDFVKKLVKQSNKAHEQFVKVVQVIVQNLKIKHLQQIFYFITSSKNRQSDLTNPHLICLVQSVVNNVYLAANKKKKKHQNARKQSIQMRGQKHCEQNELNNVSSAEQHAVVYEIFYFLYRQVQDVKYESLYMPLLCKHISVQIFLLFHILEQELTNRLGRPKNYESFVLNILQHMLKIDIDSMFTDLTQKKIEEKQKQKQLQPKQGIKFEFINNLVMNCHLYDSLVLVLAKKRFDRGISQKCLSILVLVTKAYKPLQKALIEQLWKIIGMHCSNEYQKQQFFLFIKQILKSSVNLSEESVKHIYFEIILKLQSQWFTPKIYDCFEMLFMRLNEDGKLLTYQGNQNNNANSNNQSYLLNKTQFVGIQKFYYLYFWAQQKVSKKSRDFLFKLYSYKSTAEIKQKFSYEIIDSILRYLKRDHLSEDHILHATSQQDYQMHVNKGFEFLLKFVQGISKKITCEQTTNQQNTISVTIHNVTRQANAPTKKTLQVNRNMLLKEFKQLVKRQVNPAMVKQQIQLINKGKHLRFDKMTLKQLRIENKNTILVQNYDMPKPRKQTEQKKLTQCKETLYAIFAQQYDKNILDYVAEKCMGQQLQKICEWIMDEDKMRQIQDEIKNKATQSIQMEKIEKKMYENSNEDQILSFGQLLSKQLQLLLSFIQQSPSPYKLPSTNKQWNLIYLIPANAQVYRNIEQRLLQQSINFEGIFSMNNQGSINVQIYIWHLLCKMINSAVPQFKRKLYFQKGLEKFIIDRLKRALHTDDSYNQQLFRKIIQAYELVVQIAIKDEQNNNNPQMKDRENQNMGNNNEQEINFLDLLQRTNSRNGQHNYIPQERLWPSMIVPQAGQVLSNCHSIVRTIQLTTLSHPLQFYQLLLNLLKARPICQQIASKLLSLVLFNIFNQLSTSNQTSNNLQQFQLYVLQFLTSPNQQIIYYLTGHYKEGFLKFLVALNLLLTNVTDRLQNATRQQYMTSQNTQMVNQQSGGHMNQQQRLPNHQIVNYGSLQQMYKANYMNLRWYLKKQQLQEDVVIDSCDSKNSSREWLYFLLVAEVDFLQINHTKRMILERDSMYHNNNSSQIYSTNKNLEQDDSSLQKDFIQLIALIMHRPLHMPQSQLLGIVCLVAKLSHFCLHSQLHQLRHLRNSNFIAHNLQLFIAFISFLTNEFIYTTPNVPILTSPIIKLQFYSILLIFSECSLQLLKEICDKVINIGVQQRNHQNDTIDFRKSQFVGIQNLGCTCYVNSLTQQLYHTKLPYKLLSIKNEQGLFALNHTFMQLFMSAKNVINIRPMIQQVKLYGQEINPVVQQDVQEFLISLLDYIESCKGRQIVDSIFGGSYSEELTYFSQRQQGKILVKHKQEHFYNITLDIKNKKTLTQALKYFFRSQPLDDKILCEEFNEKTSVIKRTFIKNFPKILIFTLKRFQFDVQSMVRSKLNDYLQFPMQLDLTQFSLDHFLQSQKASREFNQYHQSQSNKSPFQQSHLYTLCGVLIHSGSAQAGHYYSYIHRENRWFEFNDRVVTEINLQDRIKIECFGGTDVRSRNAYMLFYQKRQTAEGVRREQEIKNMQMRQKQEGNKNKIMEDKEQMLTDKIQIQVQQNKIKQQQEPQNTLPLSQPERIQQSLQHHGIFLSQIPENNYFKQLVRDQNNQFIKQRLIYDYQYRRFLQQLLNRTHYSISQIKSLTQGDSQLNSYEQSSQILQMTNMGYQLEDKMRQIQHINEIINPPQHEMVVHYASNQIMEVEGIRANQGISINDDMKEMTYEEQERRNQLIAYKQRQNGDIVSDLLDDCI